MKYKAESLEQALCMYGDLLDYFTVYDENGIRHTIKIFLFKSRFYSIRYCGQEIVSIKRLSEMKRKINQEKRESKGDF